MSTDARSTCPDPELMTALVDGELERDAQESVLIHLGSCADCRADAEAERAMRNAVHDLGAPAPSADLVARLLAVPNAGDADAGPDVPAEVVPLAPRRRSASVWFGAAASVAVFMVGVFAFVGASAQPAERPTGTTAVVPAADRLAEEHAATTAQAGLGGPGFSTVPVSVPLVAPTVAP